MRIAFDMFEMMWEKLYYSAIQSFYKMKRYDLMKRMIKINKLHQMKKKANRLEPSGHFEGIMFIGINPSEASSLTDIWSDPYGQYFGEMLDEAEINRKKIWITNLYKISTPGNRPLDESEMYEGKKELLDEIIMVNPSVIVALGNQVQSIFKDVYNSIPVVKLSHPSYIKRFANSEKRSNFINSLRALKQYV